MQKVSSKLEERERRFDVTLLISGLPIIQIELKLQLLRMELNNAYYQIEKYVDEGTFSNTIFSNITTICDV